MFLHLGYVCNSSFQLTANKYSLSWSIIVLRDIAPLTNIPAAVNITKPANVKTPVTTENGKNALQVNFAKL